MPDLERYLQLQYPQEFENIYKYRRQIFLKVGINIPFYTFTLVKLRKITLNVFWELGLSIL